jgi:hypothetical protein
MVRLLLFMRRTSLNEEAFEMNIKKTGTNNLDNEPIFLVRALST